MAISQEIHQSSVTKFKMTITHLKCHHNLAGANELKEAQDVYTRYCFAVICCGCAITASVALGPWYNCPEWYGQNKSILQLQKHNNARIVCICLGVYFLNCFTERYCNLLKWELFSVTHMHDTSFGLIKEQSLSQVFDQSIKWVYFMSHATCWPLNRSADNRIWPSRHFSL